MATTGPINTTLLGVYVGGTKIAHLTSASLSLGHSPRDISSKDTGAWKAILEGQLEWSISGDGWMAYDATYGSDELDGQIIGRTAVTVMFSTEVAGDTRYTGSAFMESMELGSPGQNETATHSFSFTGTGALTPEIVT